MVSIQATESKKKRKVSGTSQNGESRLVFQQFSNSLENAQV